MPQIQYLAATDIDEQKWNAALAAAANGLVYAHTDFMDAFADDWEGAVVGDYEAVMPIPFRRKLGIRYICQPAFCQQLGLFGSLPNLGEWQEAILKHTVSRFRLIEWYLNAAIEPISYNSRHTNMLLALDQPIERLRIGFKQDLTKNLVRAEKFNLDYGATTDFSRVVNMYQQQYADRFACRKSDFEALKQLAGRWHAAGCCIARVVSLPQSGEWLACALLFDDGRRLYNLASTTLPNGRTLEANHVLFYKLIEEYAGTGRILDFEGSELPGVARFYQKFGPTTESYYFWKSNRLPAVMRWWKR